MTSDATLVLNLTFLGTVMIAAVLGGLIVFFACVALAFTGLGRLVYIGVGRLVHGAAPERGTATIAAADDGASPGVRAAAARAAVAALASRAAATVTSSGRGTAAGTAVGTPGNGAREKAKPVLNPEWRQAVREADARALAKATDSGLLPTVAKVSNPVPPPVVKAQELLAEPAAAEPGEKAAPRPGRPGTLRPVSSTGPATGPVTTIGKGKQLSLKPGRQEGIARKNMPGLVLPAEEDREQHAKGA